MSEQAEVLRFRTQPEEAVPLVLPPITSGAHPHNGRPEYRQEFKCRDGETRTIGGQVLLIEAAMQFEICVVPLGRRCGKTTGCAFLLMEEGAHCDEFYFAAYVAQAHPQAEEMYEQLLSEWTEAGLVVRKKNKGQDRWIQLRPFGRNQGMRVWFWSGEEGAHDNARGKGLHRLIIDEAGYVPIEAWTESFGPMLVDRQGKAVIMGTPNPEGVGFAWFRDEFLEGIDAEDSPRDPDYCSLNFPTEANPTNDVATVARWRARVRKRKGAAAEKSEYDALFMEDIGGVFENLNACFVLEPKYQDLIGHGDLWIFKEASRTTSYCMSIDWGEHDDRTAVGIFDQKTRDQVAAAYFERDNYDSQLECVDELYKRYFRPRIIADERDAGKRLCQELRNKYRTPVIGVKFSSGGDFDKGEWVTRCREFFMEARWRLMKIHGQREEVRLYSKKKLPSKGYRYEAPSGKHDDWVSMLIQVCFFLEQDYQGPAEDDEDPDPFSREWFLRMQKLQRQARGEAGYEALR